VRQQQRFSIGYHSPSYDLVVACAGDLRMQSLAMLMHVEQRRTKQLHPWLPREAVLPNDGSTPGQAHHCRVLRRRPPLAELVTDNVV
jgi:hypothetical protein